MTIVAKSILDISEILKDEVEKDKSELISNIFNAITENTPVRTGTLRASWDHGTTKSEYVLEPGEYAAPPLLQLSPSEKGWDEYYIWNNQRYTGFVNDSLENFSFIEFALVDGLTKSSK